MKKEALFYDSVEDNKVHCFLCSHNCKVSNGAFGMCGVRKNEGGKLYSLNYGIIVAAHVDPVEKKPLYHYLPGTKTYSIAIAGCNFKCSFCQNWEISQYNAGDNAAESQFIAPEEIVKTAQETGCRSVSYTYTEPTIFFEYALDTAILAKKAGLGNIFVTNGYMSSNAIEKIHPYLNAANIDLKSFSDAFYKKVCKGSLEPVLESIRQMKKAGIWIEVTTLIVPGLNDSRKELTQIAEFIAKTGKEIPWHISRFHPDYKLTNSEPTPHKTLQMAFDIGKGSGLKYVYLGNVTGGSDTLCHICGISLIRRNYFDVLENIVKNSKCPKCSTKIDGIFKQE